MRSEIEPFEEKYPQLKVEEDGTIVLFTSNGEGTVVRDPENYYGLGHFYDNWPEGDFRTFRGTLRLEND